MAKLHGVRVAPNRFDRSQIKFYFILAPFVLVALLPLIYIIVTAFKPIEELFAYPPKFWVNRLTLDNFRKLFGAAENTTFPMSIYLFNSIVSTLCVVAGGLVISLCVAYVLSKGKLKGKEIIFKANTMSMMFVGTVVGIPRYLIMKQLGLLDTFLANIIPLLILPVGVFLLKQFIDQVPKELLEAARIDGASEYRILFGIVAPTVKPAMATVVILFFQSAWNGVEASNMFINTEGLKTFSYYMNVLTATGNGVAGRGMAAVASLIVIIPNVVLFLVMQSKVMDTMAHSGLK